MISSSSHISACARRPDGFDRAELPDIEIEEFT
jgi:hypothetical protein